MSLLFIITLIVLLLVVLLFTAAMKIIFTFNTDSTVVNLTFLWLYPFLKGVITYEDTAPVLKLYFFKKCIISKALKAGKHKPNIRGVNKMKLIRSAKTSDFEVRTSYGFRDPAVTGLTFGALNFVSGLMVVDSLYQDPDFTAGNDYIFINATANLNIGSTLVNLIKTNNTNQEKEITSQN